MKDWRSRFHITENHVEKVIDRRFKKNYDPAWAAAFILDPLYLVRDTSGKYLPHSNAQHLSKRKDVDKLMRLKSVKFTSMKLVKFMSSKLMKFTG